MNELEIREYLKQDEIISKYFRGVMSYDRLPRKAKPGLYVINTDVSSGPGIHWISIFIDDKIYYFDSLGEEPKSLKPFLIQQKREYVYSTKRLQGYHSNVCGDYCILFAYFICRKHELNWFLSLFTSNTELNDQMVKI